MIRQYTVSTLFPLITVCHYPNGYTLAKSDNLDKYLSPLEAIPDYTTLRRCLMVEAELITYKSIQNADTNYQALKYAHSKGLIQTIRAYDSNYQILDFWVNSKHEFCIDVLGRASAIPFKDITGIEYAALAAMHNLK